jgi:pilus assembly protein Flp/PilA
MAGRRTMGKLVREDRGAAAVEYGFVVALVVIAIIAAIKLFGQANLDVWTNVAAKVTAA